MSSSGNGNHNQARRNDLAPPAGEAGFSILEVTVAMAVFLIGMLGAAATLSAALHTKEMSREHQAASEGALAHQDLVLSTAPELIEALWDGTAFLVAFDETWLIPAESTYYPLATDDPLTPVDESATWAGHVEVTADPDGDGTSEVLEVRIVVAWRSLDGTNQRVEYVTRTVKP